MLATIAIVVLSGGVIADVANIAVFMIFLVYAVVNVALIWLRYRQPALSRPFRSPVTIRGYPVLAGIGLVTSLAMLTQFDLKSAIAGIITIGLGVISYLVVTNIEKRKVS
jgi:APA family basic amino acid/polyamine antiporter